MVKKLPPKAHKTQILPIKPAVLRTFGATCPIVGNLASLTKTRQIVAEGLRREGSHIVEASGACAIVLSKREVAELALATLDKSPAASLKAFHTTLANIPKRPTLGLHLGKFYVIQHRDAPSNDEPVVIAELYRDKEGSAAPAFDARFGIVPAAKR